MKKSLFLLWYKEVEEICEECYGYYAEDIDMKDWKDYFENNVSPAAAVAEEFYYE